MTQPVRVGGARWPDGAWTVPVLRGIDVRGRGELEGAGGLRELRQGELLFREGEPADAFFVVLGGAIELRGTRRGESETRTVRRVQRGETVGEEATLGTGGVRTARGVCVEQATVAIVPAHVFKRLAERAGAGEVAGRIVRTLQRAVTLDFLCTSSFTAELPEPDREIILDAVEHVRLARGETLYRAGELARHAYLVADGMLQVQSEEAGRLSVRAYLSRGDLVGETDALRGLPHELGVAASGPSWVLAVPRPVFAEVARRHPALLERAARLREDKEHRQAQIAGAAHTTQHVLKDLYRVSVARSLLVIDQDVCVRCGHCASSCAGVHGDGTSRLVRRGDKVVAPLGSMGRATLLLPNSCQHCEHPACMLDCPTGAIGRDPRGEVFIRESLCIGCGACAKGCPWENIQMAPRAGGAPDVAVKCDLCRGSASGPACVVACPVEAIARVSPDQLVPGLVGPQSSRPRPPKLFSGRLPAWPWIGGAILTALALAASDVASPFLSGGTALLLVAVLAAHPIVKRIVRAKARPWYLAHVALGVIGIGAVLAHAGLRVPPNLAGALAVSFWSVSVLGVLGALVYRAIPARIARVERRSALPEDLAAHARSLEERAFGALTGRSELVKAIYARFLRPYSRARLGALALVVSGRSLHEEELRLRARIEATLRGRGRDKLEGLDAVIRLVVERRGIGAQRVLGAALRAWMPAHAIAATALGLLLIVHVFFELVYR